MKRLQQGRKQNRKHHVEISLFNAIFQIVKKPESRERTPYRNSCLGKKNLSLQVTTDSDTVFCEESIGEGFKVVTIAAFLRKSFFFFFVKFGPSLMAI